MKFEILITCFVSVFDASFIFFITAGCSGLIQYVQENTPPNDWVDFNETNFNDILVLQYFSTLNKSNAAKMFSK